MNRIFLKIDANTAASATTATVVVVVAVVRWKNNNREWLNERVRE